MSVLFSIPFSNEFLHFHSRHRYADLLFYVDSILPCTYSEFHLPVSPSPEVSLHLVCVDSQLALFSTVHCFFFQVVCDCSAWKTSMHVVHMNTKGTSPEWSKGFLFVSFFGFTPCSQIPPNQPLRVDKYRGICFLLSASREGYKMTISISNPYFLLEISA